jgi:hypothetical protein
MERRLPAADRARARPQHEPSARVSGNVGVCVRAPSVCVLGMHRWCASGSRRVQLGAPIIGLRVHGGAAREQRHRNRRVPVPSGPMERSGVMERRLPAAERAHPQTAARSSLRWIALVHIPQPARAVGACVACENGDRPPHPSGLFFAFTSAPCVSSASTAATCP